MGGGYISIYFVTVCLSMSHLIDKLLAYKQN